jgi:hypothetical protein
MTDQQITDLRHLSKPFNLAHVAGEMGRSRHWLYQRLYGMTVNGKPAKFTPEEIARLVGILRGLSGQADELAKKIESF